ncbi:MAG TPA: ABC transporter ATP-binding protein [Acidimicrobiales bacterium]
MTTVVGANDASALELQDVTKRHPGSPPVVALASVSLTIGRGEFVAVVGPSGSGKSTLLAVAGTLERPTSGVVRVAGSAVQDLPDGVLSGVRSHHIGFVFQQYFLIPSVSTLENVANGLLYRGVPADDRRRAAAEAIDAVGLSARATHRPGALSGGECQRVAIARALVGKPTIILADEPTGSLDSGGGRDILGLFSDLHRAGTTIVVVTHNPEIARAIPRTVRLRDGAVEYDGAS